MENSEYIFWYTGLIMESLKTSAESFIFPHIQEERGEFERAGKEFELDPEVLMFLAEEEGVMCQLSSEIWERLENTDSYGIKKDDWTEVGVHAREGDRDWVTLKEKITKGETLDAPIIFKYGERYHLISGNTRLMVARALGLTPAVFIFEYKENRAHE